MIGRRRVLHGLARGAAAGSLAPLSGCRPSDSERLSAASSQARWIGASDARGHLLRDAFRPEARSGSAAAPGSTHAADVLVIGGGIAGLSAMRALDRAGVHDTRLLELEDEAGGNSRGHVMAGIACPLGAHYLPVPGPRMRALSEWLESIGVARWNAPRATWAYDERMLCHSPQERLFVDGAWQEGLLPAAEPGSPTLAQYRRFADEVDEASRTIGFAIPTRSVPWTAAHAALDRLPFAAWLDAKGLVDVHLRWYLDYCCRDDYGAPAEVVSAWAGLHYFASRHGFRAPGDGPDDETLDAVLTWPEGNAFLARRLAAPFADRILPGRVALRIDEGRREVTVDAWNVADDRLERWRARRVVLAVPLFVAARLLPAAPPALAEALAMQRYAPWLVANLHVSEPLLQRVGAPPSWDNVIYGDEGLGYVDAMHQSLKPYRGETVLTAYAALPPARRAELLASDAASAARTMIEPLLAVHPDLPSKLRRVELMRHGHAMSIPAPGVRGSAAREALGAPVGRLHFAHADLAGYSIFEEAFECGSAAGLSAAAGK